MFIIPVCSALVNLFGHKEAYEITIEHWTANCEVCGAALVRDGGYVRETPIEVGPLWIQQVRCNNQEQCPGSKPVRQALLPCWVLPYQRVMSCVQHTALVNVVEGSCTIEASAEDACVDPKTVSRWLNVLRESIPTVLPRIVRVLCDHHSPADWASDRDVAHSSKLSQLFSLMSLVRERIYPWFPGAPMALIAFFWPYSFLGRNRQ